MRRIAIFLMVPTVGVLLWSMMPLIAGGETLFLRDVFNTHLEKKFVQAEAMKQGRLPLIDPLRDGGQPHLGNPNTVALYPDNLLYLVTPFFWAFNAHFWLHLLLAPFAFYWMCRSWGLDREASWIGGVCYATSGFFLSMMNLYNMIGGVTWAPILIGASLRLAPNRPYGGRSIVLVALAWAMLLLGGDPMTAGTGLILAALALLVVSGLRTRSWLSWVGGCLVGTVLAAPQLVDFLRILPLSFRGHQGFSPAAAMAASWNPITVIDWLVPFPFGRPDLTFWGQEFFGGDRPLFLSLFPGILSLLLVCTSGRESLPARRWAWIVVSLGLFLALGGYNPIVGWVVSVPGLDLLRLPVKFWLMVAVGAGLLCGLGYQRWRSTPTSRAIVVVFWLMVAFYLLSWSVLSFLPQWIPDALQPGSAALRQLAELERLRRAGLCIVSLVVLALYGLVARAMRIWPRLGAGALVVLHVASQIFFLRPMLPTEPVEGFAVSPDMLAAIPESAVVVHGKSNSLFGAVDVPLEAYPDASLIWLQKQIFQELYPVAGILHHRRYDFSISAEGLDSFLTRAAAQSLKQLPDPERIRLLTVWGADRLVLGRQLTGVSADEASLVYRGRSIGGEIFVYALPKAVAEVVHVGEVRRAPHLNAALSWMTAADFEADRTAVLPEGGPPLAGPPGSVEQLHSSAESMVARVEAEAPGVLVIQRAFLPIYKARVDDEPVPIVAANMHRLGVEVAAGTHIVEVWVDRVPTRVAAVASLLAMVALGLLAWRLRGLRW